MAVLKAGVDLVLPLVGTFLQWNIPARVLVAGFIAANLWRLGWTFGIALALFLLAVYLATRCAEMLACHSREFVADAGAIELTKNPVALISALRKISGNDGMPVTGLANKSIMFSSDTDSWFATHPPACERISAINEHARMTDIEVGSALAARAAGRATEPVAIGLIGRKPVGLQNTATPIAVPPDADWQDPARRKDWQETWIVSGRVDTIVGWLAYVLTLPWRLVASLAIGVLVSKLMAAATIMLLGPIALFLPYSSSVGPVFGCAAFIWALYHLLILRKPDRKPVERTLPARATATPWSSKT